MSAASPRKSTRAAASRRKAPIIEDSDEEENTPPQVKQESEEEFTPAPQKVIRRGRARKTVDETATPKTSTRRRTRHEDAIEPSQIFSPESSVVEPVSPTKKQSPRKRSSGKTTRKSRASVAGGVVEDSQLPTPDCSVSPEPPNVPGTPLADITENAINESTIVPETQNTVEKVNPHHTVLEKPMDIIVRKRAALPVVQEPAVPKSRLVITYLVLTNFKSYAGRQEVGPFHASFSSVVGPNGSGKSNVIDSLLFVFGFRASKMRQGKISALIHNSAAFPNLEYCEVEVHFQEVMDLAGGGHDVIPDSRLVISRRAFKNNASKYYINNKESNFTVVTTLLRDRGIDLDHKRFLILQGEVESIAQMKPKAANEHDDGLLEYLEDIIGTSKYKTPIDEAAAETETLNEVCSEKSNRVQHVEKEKSGLEDKKNKALAFIRDENELATKQAALYQLFISDFDDHIQVSQESVTQMQAQLDEELEKHHGSEEVIKQLEKQYKKGTKEYEQLEKQTQAVLKEMARIDKETVKFEEKKKFLAGKQKKLEKAKETSKFGISESDTLAKQYADDIERCAAEIADLEKTMKVEEKELEAIRASLAGKTQGLSDQIAAKQKSLEPWSAKINEKQSAIAVAQSELDILREKENAGAVAISDVEAKIASFEENKNAKTAELEECKAEKKKVEKGAQKVKAQIDDLTQKEPTIRMKLSGARQKADEARASLSATQTQGNVLTGLMRLKESGRINGFHGRLGNLGTIDQKYDVAISTACPALDNLVVDSVEVGQQCIDYLRKNNLGRANFILLDRLAHRDLSEIETPENIPRLFDLVTSKHDNFKPAFFSVLQNTLVAKDLEQANRVAYGAKRWRVVTLDGQLIDKSGTMSGGGTRVAKGGMSSKLAADVSKDQVVKLEHDRDALEQSFAELQQQQRELETALRELKEQIPQLETRAQKIALELDSFDRNIADSHRRIKELSAEQSTTKSDKGRILALEKSIASLKKEVSKLHAETADVEAEIKALQDKIMEIGGVKLRSQKAKVDGLKQHIDTLSETTSTAEVSKSKAEKQLVKYQKAYADATKELENVAADAEKVEEDMQIQKRDAAGTRQQAEEAQEALDTRKEELHAVKKELDEKTAELNETRAIEIEMRNKLEGGQKNLNEFQKKQRFFQDKLDKLSYQNLSELGEEQESAGPPTYSKDELQDMDKGSLQEEIAILEKKNENTNVDLSVLAEYRKRVEEHAARSLDLADAVAQRDAAKKRCDELRRLRLEGFMEGFSTISLRLKEMYQMITMGGNAELELVDSLDPFSEGILFSVMPPKKSWKNISNLSGGEKTLSSLALVFALHHYKPTPLYVMDEIDAALDFRNVSIVASYIKERTKNAQFIVISLRNNMFELASRLVGVYKVNHMTKSVTIENKDYLTGRA
ncbi:condensin subunit Cut3 [Lindgomyces ingoldianus]|uniref:Condensin subunit Cut3 n=1 Tax=Lindgomyces ingoldianus TaxID=673940 RepID=A0ACB6QTX3_9PLEO|nr:condensin subunit Cut3 [Lindgomyces ingoldianus]KAF2470454.1 condensin subunit Cut3 [Lindgomyces ingoldianus]